MLDDEQKIEVGYVPDDGDDLGQKETSEAVITQGKKVSLKKLQHELEKVQKERDAIRSERDEYQDKYLRTLADFDNFRKRMRREKEEFQQYHLADFMLDLLPVYDNLERALKVQKSEIPNQSVLSGVEMIFKLLTETLKKFGIEEIAAQKTVFDPSLHQALSKVEDASVKEATVMDVYQKGFFYNGKLLRPALVRVALPAEAIPEEVNDKE